MSTSPNIPEEDDSSLEKPHRTKPRARKQQTTAVSFLRIITWIAPGPAIVFILGAKIWLFGGSMYADSLLLEFVLSILITAAIGYCNAFVSNSVKKNSDGIPVVREAIGHMCTFTILQIIIAPFVVVVCLLGLCIVYTANGI